jgi:hypothetical protein
MNATSKKKLAEVVSACEPAKKVYLVGCSGCPLGMETGGPAQLQKAAAALQEAGKAITGRIMIDMVCNKALDGIRLGRHADDVRAADAIVVYSCGVGVQAIANMTMKPVAPGLNTIHVGGMQGLWPSKERCGQCGDCLLAYTGGICPITACSKSLVNGTCGGTNRGKCEVSKDKDCGWYLIYERLKALGRLGDLQRMTEPRNHELQDIPNAKRGTMLWALESEKVEQPAAAPKKKKKAKKKAGAKKKEAKA